MYYNIYQNDFEISAGIPYDEIKWYNIEGQPFGSAVHFNVITFENGVNIVDIQGAVAIGQNFISSRGFSVGFGKGSGLVGTGYSPDAVRFMVGNNVTIDGTLTAVGNVVVGNEFFAESGSTYLIGKNFSPDQEQSLERLYAADGGSQYWKPANKGNYYAISSYDVPRFIKASSINANLKAYFEDARNSIEEYKACIERLEDNGEVMDNDHEWLLVGEDEEQNVFTIDATKDGGVISKGIRTMVPESSVSIIRIKSGNDAYIRYGLWGEKKNVNQTLYVFEDATDIFMDVPAAIWGSILAPQAIYHGHETGGVVSGNAALRGFEVDDKSGFEFHWYPFIGGVICSEMEQMVMPIQMPVVEERMPARVETEILPETRIERKPEVRPEVRPEGRPEGRPKKTVEINFDLKPNLEIVIPKQKKQPRAIVRIPDERIERPIQSEKEDNVIFMPEMKKEVPIRKEKMAIPFDIIPIMPEQSTKIERIDTDNTCKVGKKKSTCPICMEDEWKYESEDKDVNECGEMNYLVEPGMITGTIHGCSCNCNHNWKLRLYAVKGCDKVLMDELEVANCQTFEFAACHDFAYVLQMISCCCDSGICRCKPSVSFQNVGVVDLKLDF